MADKIDVQIEHYASIAERHKLTSSVWSMFEIGDLSANVPFEVKTIKYAVHWGPKPIIVPDLILETWIDVWRACDLAIRLSGDQHHIFIEQLIDRGNGVYELMTGS